MKLKQYIYEGQSKNNEPKSLLAIFVAKNQKSYIKRKPRDRRSQFYFSM